MSFCQIFIRLETIIYNDRTNDVGDLRGVSFVTDLFPVDIYTREMDLPRYFFISQTTARWITDISRNIATEARMDCAFNIRLNLLEEYPTNIPATLLGQLAEPSRSEMTVN